MTDEQLEIRLKQLDEKILDLRQFLYQGISDIQKRIDALEHPDLFPTLKAFQDLRKSLSDKEKTSN